jgi:hypothetical protein
VKGDVLMCQEPVWKGLTCAPCKNRAAFRVIDKNTTELYGSYCGIHANYYRKRVDAFKVESKLFILEHP